MDMTDLLVDLRRSGQIVHVRRTGSPYPIIGYVGVVTPNLVEIINEATTPPSSSFVRHHSIDVISVSRPR